jgi:hypothetical protein
LIQEQRICKGGELCITSSDLSIATTPLGIVRSSFSLLSSDIQPFWRVLAFVENSFCANNEESVGVSALFVVQDTICTSSILQFTNLSNGGANEVIWELVGANVPSSNSKNPKNIFYQLPGFYDIRQIVNGVCSSDTFERSIVVLELPTFSIPSDTLICNDSIVHIVPIFNPSFKGRWQDSDFQTDRIFNMKGTYIFEVSNQEICIFKDSIEINFVDIDLQIIGPSESCEGPLDIMLSNQFTTNFQSFVWSIDPPVEPTIEQADRLFYTNLVKGNYLISYDIVYENCPISIFK